MRIRAGGKRMRRLPERPDLDQLRRQAKELHHQVKAGDKRALARLGSSSKEQNLAAAQLTVAREYGFSSWAKLKQDVEQRRRPAARSTTAPMVRSWESMREWMPSLLLRKTGKTVEDWNQAIVKARVRDELSLRRWLAEQGVTGYSQRLLVWERFGYPGFMTTAAFDLISRQYADRPQLRPILDAILATLPDVSPVITVQTRKTYISLVSERRTFAVVQATTKNRVDLGLRLDDARPGGRLSPGKGIGNG